MKRHFLSLFVLMSLLAACTQAPDSDKATVAEAKPIENKVISQGYQIDTQKSTVGWVGTKPTGQHNGTFDILSGVLETKDNKVIGGRFTIDIKSMKVIDLTGESAKKLEGHLLGDDFFKSDQFPTADFEIAEVELIDSNKGVKMKLEGATHMVIGNLRLLDKTRSITFPARIFAGKNSLAAQANFNINRADWGMVYHNSESLGDKFIRPEVNIKLNLIGK